MKTNPHHYLTCSLVCYYFATCASLIFLLDSIGAIDIKYKQENFEEDIWASDFIPQETTNSLTAIFTHWSSVRPAWRCLGAFMICQLVCNSVSFLMISFFSPRNTGKLGEKATIGEKSKTKFSFCLTWNFLFTSVTALVNFGTLLFYSFLMTHENDDVANKVMFRERFFNYNYLSEILSVLLSIIASVLVVLDHEKSGKKACRSRSSIGAIDIQHGRMQVDKFKLEMSNPSFVV